jgi:MFS transporter, ACS family, DAL5 transporter family protein
MGIKTDIHLVGADYQWLGSIFYIGFLAWEVRYYIHTKK